MAVRVVERVIVQEHDTNECVHRIKASPVAARQVLNEVVRGPLACLEGSSAVALPADARALYDVEGAAAYLNIPARWVADAVRDGKIRHERFGKHIRFTQEHLGEFIAACERPVTAQVVPLRDRRRAKL